MRKRSHGILALSMVLTGSYPGLGAAQGAAQSVQEQESAEDAQAANDFYSGRYQQALERYAKLYSKNPDPIYLKNLARCHQKLGDTDEALTEFRQYLRIAPNLTPAKREEVEGFIRELENRKKEEQAEKDRKRAEADRAAQEQAKEMAQNRTLPPAPTPPQPEFQPQPPFQPQPQPPIQSQPQPYPPVQPLPPREAGPSDSGRGLRIAGLTAGGVGVASIVVGAIFGSRAKSAAHDLEARTVPGATYDPSLKSIDERGRQSQTREWIFLGVGAAALAGGGLLYFLGSREDQPREPPAGAHVAVIVLPAVSPRDLGAALRVSY